MFYTDHRWLTNDLIELNSVQNDLDDKRRQKRQMIHGSEVVVNVADLKVLRDCAQRADDDMGVAVDVVCSYKEKLESLVARRKQEQHAFSVERDALIAEVEIACQKLAQSQHERELENAELEKRFAQYYQHQSIKLILKENGLEDSLLMCGDLQTRHDGGKTHCRG